MPEWLDPSIVIDWRDYDAWESAARERRDLAGSLWVRAGNYYRRVHDEATREHEPNESRIEENR